LLLVCPSRSLWRRAWQYRPRSTTQHQTCKTKTKTKTDFLVWDRSCPKTDDLRSHYWKLSIIMTVTSGGYNGDQSDHGPIRSVIETCLPRRPAKNFVWAGGHWEIYSRIDTRICGLRPSVLGQDRSETKKLVLVLQAVVLVLVLVLQFWCCFVKHDLVMLVVITILKDTATFKVLFIVSLFCAWNIYRGDQQWRSFT